jgi:hypothetical protein
MQPDNSQLKPVQMKAPVKTPAKRRFEPMLLLVIGIPLLTVIAGAYTMVLAFNGPHESAVVKPEPNFKGMPLR